MNITRRLRKMKNTLKEIFEIDALLREFRNRKAEYLNAMTMGSNEEVLVRIESELTKLRKDIYAKDRYTNVKRFINWN